ncbi:MAG: DUF4139 domain-containing protein [Planctomycetes bacterium]|nr:DUF4139 domain-containing protein [Planctomycetota bacterium]
MQIVGGRQLAQKEFPGGIAEGGEGIEIRAVRYRARAVGQEPREEVRKLDDAIEELTDNIATNQMAQQLMAKRAAYLDKLEGFVAPTAKAELSKGVLDAVALEKITEFSFAQRQEIGTQQLKLAKESKSLQRQISLLQRKRSELTNGASRTVREAIVFIEKRMAGKASLKLNYLVNGCGWSPTYALRASKDRKQVAVEYSAVIAQMSGEDWSEVKLTLSTASPALSASGLGLAPFQVSLSQNGQAPGPPVADLAKQLQGARGRQQDAIIRNSLARSFRDNVDNGWLANAAANEFQNFELIGGKDVLQTIRAVNRQATEGPSLSYQLEGAVSLASRSDQQMIRVMTAALKSRFYHVATPVLTSFVYREAEMTNDSPEDLLAGPVTVYLDGRFVGRGEIPTVARGETFLVGFGVDPQLRARRELAKRTDEVQGGNRELSLSYRLVIENFKEEEATVRLLDRLPYTKQSGQIRVTLGELTDKLSDDKIYLRRERPKGILRWEIKVPGGATAEDARIVQYGFKAEFDRNFRLAAVPSGGRQQQQEYEQLQQLRRKR